MSIAIMGSKRFGFAWLNFKVIQQHGRKNRSAPAYLWVRSALFAFLNFTGWGSLTELLVVTGLLYPDRMSFHTLFPRVSCHTPYPFPHCSLYLLVCLDNRSSAHASPLAPMLRHSGPFSQCCSFFRRQFFSVLKDLTRKRGLFSHQWRSLRYYMVNKNIVLDKIPGCRVPISAIWVVLKLVVTKIMRVRSTP